MLFIAQKIIVMNGLKRCIMYKHINLFTKVSNGTDTNNNAIRGIAILSILILLISILSI